MSSDSLIQALPDLIVRVRRDGIVLAMNAGHGVGDLRPPGDWIGKHINELWPEAVATLIHQLLRKCLANRNTAEAQFRHRGRDFEVRLTAQGPDRAVCILRGLAATRPEESLDATGERLGPHIDRRGFLRRLKESLSMASLREKAMAVAVIHVEGMLEIAQGIAPRISEQIMTAALLRLPVNSFDASAATPAWYLGQLSDSLLAIVIETADRETIETCVAEVCDSLRQPVVIGPDVFHLNASAGAAILGEDASSARALLDHARAAGHEARRTGATRVRFFTDTLQLKALARLDLARELRDAIASRDIRLRYQGRHDLATGRLVACVAYMQWIHPLRGEIRAAEFLPVAEATGLASVLSNASLQWLTDDFQALSGDWDPDVRVSFGALRHHLSHEDFVGELAQFVATGAIAPERLELRISDRSLGVHHPNDFKSLARRGVQLVVDEVGRGVAPLDWLARAPLAGIQLHRAWAAAVRTDPTALKICRAVVGIARGLGVVPIAPGVDDEQQWQALSGLGFAQGSGDRYPPIDTRQSRPKRSPR